ncbi:hypothetical protein [Paenibacillus sp. USDA918EY]|uniref:hypothetical protein n=1 Tax=Paenibacillus sp. USDA918EY TaxID=2689575 RepID=UPI00191784CD|nr:hypothetical protein [Paenibacillus sp. USDA918EY]
MAFAAIFCTFSIVLTFPLRMKSIITALKTAHAAPDQPEQHVFMKDGSRPIENDNHFCTTAIVFPKCNFMLALYAGPAEK